MPDTTPYTNLSPEQHSVLQDHCTTLAPTYDKLTAQATKHLLTQVLDSIPLNIKGLHLVHDNASGTGCATSALIEWCGSRHAYIPNIHATDCNEAMLEQVRAKGWKDVRTSVEDSHALSFDEGKFNFVFCNFSISQMERPLKGLFEIHRTLKPAGIAVVTAWKRDGVRVVLESAVRRIRVSESDGGGVGDGAIEAFRVGRQFEGEGYLAGLMDRAGWEQGKVKTLMKTVVVKDATSEMEGLREFWSGEATAEARIGWSEEQLGGYPRALDEAIQEECEQHGGVLMEAWVLLARKWDAMYA